MPRYVKKDKVIEATEKAFNVIYKEQGFTLESEDNEKKSKKKVKKEEDE